MSDLKKVTALLEDKDPERRAAAAVVVGALELKDAKTLASLAKLLDGAPEEQRAALDAFARLAPLKIVPRALDLLSSATPAVREASHRALKAAGPEIVPDLKARRERATDVEKRELDRVLADLGGSNAFKALLDGLAAADEKTVHAAVLAVRERVLQADKRTRASYAGAILKSLDKAGARSVQHEAALAKILGWCEEPEATPVLLSFLGDLTKASIVRQEAAIALRATLREKKADKKLTATLFKAAESGDPGLARTACDTLAAATLDEGSLPMLRALALHPNDDRARFAIEKLRTLGGAKPAGVLVEVVALARKHLAAEARDALQTMKEAIEPTLGAVLASEDPDRARLLGELLIARKGELSPAGKKKILDALVGRLTDDGRGYDALLAVARAVDTEKAAVQLRELAAKLKKSKKDERAAHVLILLSHTAGATEDDKLRLAFLALKKSRLDPRPDARARDEAVKLFSDISGEIDIAAALRKDRSVTPEQLFYLGFHFAEEGDPIAKELLETVIERGPRTKLAKAAKNKLALEAAE
jgi:HEAT repeats